MLRIEYAIGQIAVDPAALVEGRARIELFPTGEYVHRTAGKMKVTEEHLTELAADINSRGDRIALDYDHSFAMGKGSLAAGWFIAGTASIESGSNGAPALFADVQLTPKATQEVKDGEYRFISPEWNFRWKDNAGKVVNKARLYAAALTNRAFFEHMAPIHLCDEGIESLIASHDTGGEPATTQEGTMKAIAESLGLAADADEATILAAIKQRDDAATALEGEKTTLATELEETKGKLPADDVMTSLLASAKKGEDAATELAEMKRDTAIATAIRERKIDPAQKEQFETLWAASPEGTEALFASMKAGSWAAKGSEGDTPETKPVAVEGERADSLLATGNPPDEVTIGGSVYGVDEDRSKIHTKALELLAADGKGGTYTGDDYANAALRAASELGIGLH